MITSRIRSMSAVYKTTPDKELKAQIESLRKRVLLIRNMQGFGVCGIFVCVVCMFCLFAGELFLGKIMFGISLLSMLISLYYSLREVMVSVHALNLEISNLDGV